MKLRVGKRAQRQAANIEQWWAEHSPASPDVFAGELEQTFHHLCSVRVAGVGWPTPRRPTLRRILMPRSQNHVYFVIHERAQTVHVLAIWGAPRATVPKLETVSTQIYRQVSVRRLKAVVMASHLGRMRHTFAFDHPVVSKLLRTKGRSVAQVMTLLRTFGFFTILDGALHHGSNLSVLSQREGVVSHLRDHRHDQRSRSR